jgi:hypothetical protein
LGWSSVKRKWTVRVFDHQIAWVACTILWPSALVTLTWPKILKRKQPYLDWS